MRGARTPSPSPACTLGGVAVSSLPASHRSRWKPITLRMPAPLPTCGGSLPRQVVRWLERRWRGLEWYLLIRVRK